MKNTPDCATDEMPNGCEVDGCEDCCPHDLDDGHCLNCGKDCTEDLMAKAYDDYKDRMKYGD